MLSFGGTKNILAPKLGLSNWVVRQLYFISFRTTSQVLSKVLTACKAVNFCTVEKTMNVWRSYYHNYWLTRVHYVNGYLSPKCTNWPQVHCITNRNSCRKMTRDQKCHILLSTSAWYIYVFPCNLRLLLYLGTFEGKITKILKNTQLHLQNC